MGKLFGTDGVRGVANVELTPDLAFKIGQAGAYVLTGETKHTPKILVGRDTRISGDMLEAALTAGICVSGAEVISVGVVPTPAVAYLTRHYNADAGVVISASHNPFEFNGIKFFDSKGYKLPDEVENSIEDIVLGSENAPELPKLSGAQIGKRSVDEEAVDEYIEFLKKSTGVRLDGLKIAIDCANGAAFQAAPTVLFELGAEVSVINDEPDGININHNCGSTHLNELKAFVKETGADIGLAFDGDADRVLAVDEKGEMVDGDRIMAIIGLHLKKQGKLSKDTIVATVMSNLGLGLMGKQEGINIVKAKVGDRYVLEEMRKEGYNIGGEQSGHIIFLDHNTTGDGLLTALNLLGILKQAKEEGRTMSDLAGIMQVFPQVLVNAKISNANKHSYMEDSDVRAMIAEIEAEFADEGRVLIRPSGTEPLVRVMIEGRDQDYITKRAKELAQLLEKKLGNA